MRKKLYDKDNKRLVFIDRAASTEFWDEQWEATAAETFFPPPKFRMYVNITKKYLPLNSKILEGGCGLGAVANALQNAKFVVHGLDFAPKVIKTIKKNWPHLSVSQGDVRSLKFKSDEFDGYWSLGVIEHFPDGYTDIISEMKRVIKPGGYLFLTFPAFNTFRRIKAQLNKYESLKVHPCDDPNFYQFALEPAKVINDLNKYGFTLEERRGCASLDGIAEETFMGFKSRQYINMISPRLGTILSLVLDKLLGKYIGHTILLVLRKN